MATLALSFGGGAGGGALGGALAGAILGPAGIAAGAAIGAAVGQAAGGLAGGIIDKMFIEPALFGNRHSSSGLTIDDLRLQTASEGSPIKFIIGEENRIAGTVLWLGSFQTDAGGSAESNAAGGGKGAANPTSTAYTISLAIGICEGPIEGIDTIWADSKEIYNAKVTELSASYAPSVTGSVVGASGSTTYGYVVSSNHPGSQPYLSSEVIVTGASASLGAANHVKLQWSSVQPVQKVEPEGNFNGYNIYGRTEDGETFMLTIPPATVNPNGTLVDQTGPTDPITGSPRWTVTSGVVTFYDSGSIGPSTIKVPTAANTSTDTRYKQITVYTGTSTQEPDAFLEAAIGSGQVPAYTNIAYFVLQGLDLTDWGNRVPQFTVLARQHTGANAQYAVDTLLSRCTLDESHWNTSSLTDTSNTLLGYPLAGPVALDKSLDPIVTFYDLLTSETNGVLTFFNRSSSSVVVSIPTSDLGAHESGDGNVTRLVKVTDQADYDLPSQMEVIFVDPTRNYQQSSMIEKKLLGGGGSTNTISLPLTITALQARKLGRRALWGAWAERQSVEFQLPPSYYYLQEGDLVTVPIANTTANIRITSLDVGYNWLIKVEGVIEQAQILNPPADADDGSVSIDYPYNPSALILVLMDIPPLVNTDIDVIGLYWCVCPSTFGDTFKSATLFSSSDAGSDYFNVDTCYNAAYIGYSNSALAAPPTPNFTTRDDTNQVTVTMLNGTLTSASTTDVQNGSNLCLLGLEIIAFETATLVGVNQYVLSSIWRGLRDTVDTSKTGTHALNDQFVVLSGQTGIRLLPHLRKSIGASLVYKAVPAGEQLDVSEPTTFVAYAATTIPFRPLNLLAAVLPAQYASTDEVAATLVGTYPVSTDIAFSWSRHSVEQDYTFSAATGQPNDFVPEVYVIRIYQLVSGAPGSQLGTTYTATGQQHFYYTTQQQTADGHTLGDGIWVEVSQQGDISLGNTASGPIDGNAGYTTPPTTPPPSLLVAMAGNSSAVLSWTAPSGTPVPQYYVIKRGTVNGGPYVTVGTVTAPLGQPVATSYVDGGLTNGTEYFYVVEAVANGAASSNSNQVGVTPIQPTSADGSTSIPSAPTSLTATPGSEIVSLAWVASTPVSASTYNVLRSTTNGGPYTTVETGITSVSHTDTGLTNGTTYYYVVTGTNDTGNSAQSGQASATPSISYSEPPAPASATRTIWLDASKFTGYSNGQAVSTWSDASSNGTSVTQTTSANQPIFESNSLAGLPVVRFTGSNCYLSGGPSVSGSFYTLFVVFRPTSSDGGSHDVILSSDASWQLGYNSGQMYAVAVGGYLSQTAFTPTIGTGYCCTARYNGTASFRVNGTDYTQNTSPSGVPTSIHIGYATGASDVAELIVYSGTVSDSERSAIETYLNSKWGT